MDQETCDEAAQLEPKLLKKSDPIISYPNLTGTPDTQAINTEMVPCHGTDSLARVKQYFSRL